TQHAVAIKIPHEQVAMGDRRRVPQLAAMVRVRGGEVQLVVHSHEIRRIGSSRTRVNVAHDHGSRSRAVALPQLPAVRAIIGNEVEQAVDVGETFRYRGSGTWIDV